jgi:Dna[CI] antecedent, DciA
MRPDPERARLATEALARARADAWARGDRPAPNGSSRQQKQNQNPDVEPGGYGGAGSPTMRGGVWGGRPPGATRPRRDDPQPLNAAVGGLLSARGWRQRAAVGAVFGDWPLIVGPQLASHTRPGGFENGELMVTADSDAWAAQVRLMAPQLIKRLAEELGHGTVTRIRVRGPSAPPRQTGRFRAR